MTPIEYYEKVSEHLSKMSTGFSLTIDQDEIEAELKKTKPRSPSRFATDMFYGTIGQDISERRSARISKPLIKDPEDGPPPTLPDRSNKKYIPK